MHEEEDVTLVPCHLVPTSRYSAKRIDKVLISTINPVNYRVYVIDMS